MIRRAFIAGGLMMALTGCGLVKTHAPFRYRLTVEVDTPAGARSGSSVIEVTLGEVGTTLGGSSLTVRGEAVAVDLPGGQTLFALLRSEDNVDWAGSAMFNVTSKSGDGSLPIDSQSRGGLAAVRANHRLIALPRHFPAPFGGSTPPSGYPILVRFGDVRDPKTVALVDPDDLVASFGKGCRLRRITVQLTDDPVTVGIEKRFGWWQKFREHHFDGTSTVSEDMTTAELAAHMSSGSFSTEYRK